MEAPEDILPEQVDSDTPHERDDALSAPATRRSMRARGESASRERRKPRERAETSDAPRPRTAASGARHRRAAKPVRSILVLAMVGGLVATVSLPAYAAISPSSTSITVEQQAADDAQSLIVAAGTTTTDLSRSSYAATTADELAAQKAAEEAAAAAAAAAEASSSSSTSTSTSSVDLSIVAPGSGEVRWPLDMSTITVGRGISATHQGVDLLGAFGSYEYAVAAGTVTKAGYYGDYGNVVFLQSVINGSTVSTVYAHMSTMLVSAGQTVSAGQLMGLMGMTGNATANHLHFEVRVNGSLVDPYAWLQQNAG